MNKKSGLADNPLFFNPVTAENGNNMAVVSSHSQNGVSERATGEGEQANTRTAEQVNERTPVQVNHRTGERLNERTGKRLIGRQSYNVYNDQHAKLQRLEAESKLSGKPVHISDLVRQALDTYLKRYP